MAQNALSRVLEVYLYAGRKLLPHILPMLRNDETKKYLMSSLKSATIYSFLKNH